MAYTYRPYRDASAWRQVTDDQWNNWRWQVAHRIRTLGELERVLDPSPEERDGCLRAAADFPLAITPYYASLMDPADHACPVRRLAVPTSHELTPSPDETPDPLDEQVDAPVPLVTHRYPDRVLLLVTDMCAVYCRHCTRRHFTGEYGRPAPRPALDRALAYIHDTPAVRDVLVSGGDPLFVGDEHIEYVLAQLRAIPHVEIVRLGTRAPVVCPQRITDDLCSVLRRHHPVYVNTHFNHPREVTAEAAAACARLADAGVPLGNQTVLLRDLNDCPVVMTELMHALLRIRVRPYYIYQCDLSPGLSHFRTSVRKGIELMEMLRGHTSGLAVPTFVVDAPGGGGKIPVMPNYIVTQTPDRIVLRNYEGTICVYPEPRDAAPHDADGTCRLCGTDHGRFGGLGRLFYSAQRTIEPADLERRRRSGDGHAHAREGIGRGGAAARRRVDTVQGPPLE